MEKLIITLIAILCASLQCLSQNTTFRDSYWYDMKTHGTAFYSHPVSEPSEMTISKDQIEVTLGQKKITYILKEIKEVPKKSMVEYKVIRDGTEGMITIGKGGQTLDGKTRAMITDNLEWVMLPMIRNITPAGWEFPGTPKIDVQAERGKMIGYYEFMTLGFTNKQDINKDGLFSDSYSDELNACQRDIQMEFQADGTGGWWQGQKVKGCEKSQTEFKWKLEEVVVRENKVLMLVLGEGIDSREFKVKEITKVRMVIVGDFNFGSDDTTVEAELELSKRKKKG
jgi:hypothetical protein